MVVWGEVYEKTAVKLPELRQALEDEFQIFLRQRGLKMDSPLCCGDAVIAMNFCFRDSYNARMGEKADPEVVERLKRFMRDLRSESKLAAGVCETCLQGRRKRASVGV